MTRVATLHAYDVMDSVHVSLTVREYDGRLVEGSEIVFQCQTTISGVGEPNPQTWAQDVLVGILECL